MAISIQAQAFMWVIAAGLCTMVGASVVFFPSLANLAKPNVLAVSLGFAAGIMIYISLVDIYTKAIVGFEEDGYEAGDSFIYATLTFFGGCIVMLVLDWAVDVLLAWDTKKNSSSADGETNTESPVDHHHATLAGSAPEDGDTLNKIREDFQAKIEAETEDNAETTDTNGVDQSNGVNNKNDDEDELDVKGDGPTAVTEGGKEDLVHMGWAMAASIAIHNFPEGMVTYLAYVSDPAVGIALAIGIGVHNIPEGLCVAMPLYYATGRRFYSFAWGTLSGLTEPIGALLVWLILQDGISGTANGILFGIVAGMMTVISIDELLPTAHKYTSNPKQVSYSFLFGMLFIASSLMLFNA